MLQDITAPLTLFPEGDPQPGDWILGVRGSQVALLPFTPGAAAPQPLVRVGERTIRLGLTPEMRFESPQSLRALADADLRFGALCALHLGRWLLDHRFCGRCGAPLQLCGSALRCGACRSEHYPVIAPAVILGLTYRGRLLVTRYADRPYTGPALVAGYCEVGETAETTCRREAFEETGLRIRDTRYFASQPWGLSGTLLLGYFAEVDSPEVTLADGELAEARWLLPEELPPPPDAAGPLSLTATMIAAFAAGNGDPFSTPPSSSPSSERSSQ